VADAPRAAPPDFARVFGLDDDLYLRRLVDLFDTTGSGSVCLAEFLGGRSSPARSASASRAPCPAPQRPQALTQPRCVAPALPVGVAHFAGSTSIPRDTLIRRFAFKLMDIDGNGVIPEVRAVAGRTSAARPGADAPRAPYSTTWSSL
jgi:hypothetical protein